MAEAKESNETKQIKNEIIEEAGPGTVITDFGISVPDINDFFYNDLEGYDTLQLPNSSHVMFYQEDPPQSAKYLGISPDGSLLTIKLPKEAFNFSSYGILSNAVSGNNVRIDLSQAEYGGYDNVKAMLENFKTDPQLAAYYATIGADNQDLFERNGMQHAANMRLLYTNVPEIPKFTTTETEESKIIKTTYGEVKDKKDQYLFCSTPYPYEIQYTYDQEYDAEKASCPTYKNADIKTERSYKDEDKISFIEQNGKYYQVVELDRSHKNRHDKSSVNIRNVMVLNHDKSTASNANKGYLAKQELIEEIENAKDIRVVLDINQLTSRANASTYLTEYPLDYNNTGSVNPSSFTNYIKNLANDVFDYRWYQYAGYVPYGLDQYHRINGVIYVQKEITNSDGKKELVWYNLNKKLIADTNNRQSPVADSVSSPTDKYHIGYGPDSLKPYTYNYANRCYVDRFWRESGENEDKRRQAQKKIFEQEGLNLFAGGSENYKTADDVLYRWTVSLGDVTFFVPPESIRVVSQTDTIRLPVMRARGTIAKGRERSMQYLELNLFFNDDRGINGAEYKVKSPNGETEFKYKMNGFRALLAQMKFTPFLPIINQYINEDLGIFAVCIEHINIGTVPGFPKLLKAQILLSKFNWQVYMPEIPQPENDSKVSQERRNPFSSCIDYDTMRWYYQRCILLGDDLDRLLQESDPARRITVNSLEFYMKTIFANRTALLPYHFQDSTISVYIADENHLKKLLQIKQDAQKTSLFVSDNYSPSENEARMIKEVDRLYTYADIKGIYAKYIGFASTLIPAVERAWYGKASSQSGSGEGSSNKEEALNDLSGNKIVVGRNTITHLGKTYDTGNAIDMNAFLDACIYEPMKKEMQAAVDGINNEDEKPIVRQVWIDNNEEAICIQLNTPYLPEPERKNTARESSVYIKKNNKHLSVSPSDIFKESTISIKIAYYQSSILTTLYILQSYFGSGAKINDTADKYGSLSFMYWCHTEGKGIVDANDEAARLKEAIDVENVRSLKYKLIVDNALVTQFQAAVGNTYARIGVTGIDGAAPQFMGGQDTRLSFTIETTDEYIASTFKSLPELTAYYTRTYRKVLPTYPVKIDSEFTRMMGVQEVTFDNVVVTTVEGFPGLYRITVNAMSVDRTLRNKEALRLLDIKNKQLEHNETKGVANIKVYKDLDTEFAKAEIYPDLELPKIDELAKLGWRYIRYKEKERNKETFFVDPDFYFVYPAITVGRAIVESLRCTFEENFPEEDVKQLLTDTTGAQHVVHKNGGIDKKDMNRAAEEDLKDRHIQKINAVKQDKIYYTDIVKSAIMRIPTGTFDISGKIRCAFTEPYYIRECKWIKNDLSIPEEKVLEISVPDDLPETLDKATKTASAEYASIRFTKEGTKEVIKEIVNPNWRYADSQKVVDLFNHFDKCAEELENHLLKNDDGLAKAKITEINADRIEFANSINDVLVYKNSYWKDLFSDYLDQSGIWKTLLSYKIFKQGEFSQEEIESGSDLENESLLALNNERNFSIEENVMSSVGYMIQAVADVLSGKEECTAANKTKNFGKKPWQADLSKPYVINGNQVSNLAEDAKLKTAQVFGIFGIKRYTYNQLYRILPPGKERDELQKANEKDKEQYYVLDPYFRYQSKEIRDQYLYNCAVSSPYCALAFMRILIWYMAKLVRYHVIPSIEFDVKRYENINTAKAHDAASKFIKQQQELEDLETTDSRTLYNKKDENNTTSNRMEQESSKLFTELKNFAQQNGQAFDAGKFFAAILLALTEEGFGSGTVFSLYNKRDYESLNGLIKHVMANEYKVRNENDPTYFERNTRLRKYLLALYGYDVINDPNNINRNVQASPASKFLSNYNTKIALEACGKPVQYMRDSFYDAIRNDYRGRMLRAFPTFYMVFADEGREVGLWKLHDNFYNFNAIHEIQIVKSRKLPADTCKLTLSNMFQTFTTNDEDCTINYKGGLGDLWASFLNPKEEADTLELRRLAAKKINRAKLQPGVRIHVRMGYGANAADLPCAFNGVIAEIKAGELVEVIAQGDGIELCNPILMEEHGDTVVNNDNFMTFDKCVAGNPAKDVLQGFLTAKGGPWAAWIRDQYRNNFWGTGWTSESAAQKLAEENAAGDQWWTRTFGRDGFIMYGLSRICEDNPYGIKHFGDPAYRKFFDQGEPAQNLYEVTNKKQSIFNNDIDSGAYFGDAALDLNSDLDSGIPFYTHDELPWISFKPYGRTVWDIMHICKSIAPDYVTGIADFQFRSTVFLGKPHFYYAYKYAYDINTDSFYEKRKPYQQWHLYNNFSDIVENKISASSEKMKTNAMGTYEVESAGSGIKKTAQMWVDRDIYPEYQKSMVVDTKLYGKSWWKHNAVAGFLGATIGKIPVIGDVGGWLLGDTVAYLTNNLMDEYAETKIDQRGPVQSHAKMAEDVVIDALKNSVKEMYQGYLIVLGDPSVKPNDRMHVEDAYEDISGMCDIREVIHSMNAETGFTTTLTPDAISCHDLGNELLKMNVLQQFLDRVAPAVSTALIGQALGPKLYSRGSAVIERGQRFYSQSELLQALKQDGSNALDKVKNLNTSQTIANKVKNSERLAKICASVGINFAKEVAKEGAEDVAKDVAKDVVKKGTGKIAGWVVSAALAVITSGINSWLYREFKGMQVLYIFPMKKFGKVLVAGLDGQQGLVYGTSQFNNPGPIEKVIGNLFAHSKKSGVLGFLSDVGRGLLIDDDVMRKADKWDIEEDSDFIAAARTGNAKTLSEAELDSLVKPQVSNAMYQPNSAYALSLMPRAMVDGIQGKWMPSEDQIKDSVWQAVRNRYYIDNVNTWTINPNLRNLIYLEDNIHLKYLFESGFLRTLPQVILAQGARGNINTDNLMRFPMYMPRGETREIIGVKRSEDESLVLDVPYSSLEGVHIIKDICKNIQENSSYFTQPDTGANNQQNKDTSIIISSALVVGSKNPYYGSGFHLILTGTGSLGKDGVLKKYVQDCYDILHTRLRPKANNYDHLPLFTIDKMTKQNEVGITIGVPSPFNNNIAAREDTVVEKVPNAKPDETATVQKLKETKILDDKTYALHVSYSDLDEYGRCGVAYTNLTYQDIQYGSGKARQDLSKVQPAGWKSGKDYDLYDRCHLIAHSLIGEEANPRNLITGTKVFNSRMNVYEKEVAEYLTKHKDATVLYKVQPVYYGKNLIPSYVIMEATDTKAKKAIFETVVVYNNDPNWTINYADGTAKKK